MKIHAMLAGGPFLTPEVILISFVALATVLIALTLFIVSIVMFVEKMYRAGFLCLFLSLVFLIPLLGFRTNGEDLLIYFAFSLIAAVLVSLVYALIYFFRKQR